MEQQTNQVTLCGDRRCTIEEVDLELKAYRDLYDPYGDQTKSTTIDTLHPKHTRIKTEIDEASELLESAKKRGSEAWDEFRGQIEAALARIKSSLQGADGKHTEGV